jgi:hypothetical protein
MSLRDRIVKVLVEEGADSEGGWHSWRCFDKERYPGPCTCTRDVADAIIDAIMPMPPFEEAPAVEIAGQTSIHDFTEPLDVRRAEYDGP